MIGTNNRLKLETDFKKITDRFRGIYERIYLKRMKQNRKMSTCNRLDSESLGSWPTIWSQKLTSQALTGKSPSHKPYRSISTELKSYTVQKHVLHQPTSRAKARQLQNPGQFLLTCDDVWPFCIKKISVFIVVTQWYHFENTTIVFSTVGLSRVGGSNQRLVCHTISQYKLSSQGPSVCAKWLVNSSSICCR